MVSLKKILKQVLNEATDKSILTSSPKPDEMKKFHETTTRLMKLMKKHKIMERSVFYNNDKSDGMSQVATIARGDVTQHLGEYEGENFKDFTTKVAQLYERAGFKVQQGYGVDDINGFEISNHDGEVIGEIDFLKKNAIPNLGDTVIVKHKR